MRNVCLYSHVTFASDNGRFNALENKVSKRIAALENQWKEAQESMEKLLNEKENKIDSLRKDLNEKNTQINALEMRVDELEKEQLTQKKHHEKRFKDLEQTYKQKIRKEKEPTVNVSTIQCNKCD